MTISQPRRPDHAILDVIAGNGVAFRFVAYAPGAVGPYPAARNDTHALVEVYDRRFKHTEHGQFTGSRYRLSTLMENSGTGRGLNVNGGVSDWTIDAATMRLAEAWFTHIAATIAFPAIA